MSHFFNPENKFWNFVAKLTDVCLMSMLWAVCSLPIFTMGASTVALYDFTMKQVRDEEGGIWKSFFSSWKKNFKKATVIWLMMLLVLAFLVIDVRAAWYLYVNAGIPGLLVLSVCAGVSLIVISATLYVFPLLAVFDFPVKKTVGDSFIMAVANLPVTVTLIIIAAIVAVLIYYVSGFYFFWIGLGVFFSSYFITGVFGKYTGETPSAEALKQEKREAKRRGKYFF
jgi:uncharacterized membrane protein YesL